MTESRPRLISTGAAARRLACSQATIRRWIDQGILPAIQVAARKQFRIPSEAVDRLVRFSSRNA